MSYSFTVTAPTKADAVDASYAKLDKVAEAQPAHAADRAAHGEIVTTMIDLLRDDDTQDVRVSMSGSVISDSRGAYSVSVNVNALLVARATE